VAELEVFVLHGTPLKRTGRILEPLALPARTAGRAFSLHYEPFFKCRSKNSSTSLRFSALENSRPP
jgi:hypothetical protein